MYLGKNKCCRAYSVFIKFLVAKQVKMCWISAFYCQNKVIRIVRNWKCIRVYLNFSRYCITINPNSLVQRFNRWILRHKFGCNKWFSIFKSTSEMISLEDLAASANISRSEAGRCFQKYYADTPMSYLIRYRLQQAQRLLLTSTLSVKEISCKCGFSDSSYFVKVFRKHMKQTPSEYRKTYTMTEER